jgi:hypothetical protein
MVAWDNIWDYLLRICKSFEFYKTELNLAMSVMLSLDV